MLGGCVDVVVSSGVKEMDFFEVFLEFPIINKSFFPFRHKLTLKLLRELHHLLVLLYLCLDFREKSEWLCLMCIRLVSVFQWKVMMTLFMGWKRGSKETDRFASTDAPQHILKYP